LTFDPQALTIATVASAGTRPALRERNDTMSTWPLIQLNDTGEDVKSVQYLLNSRGSTLTTDGIFGALTKAAVVAFQSAHGLTADGIVGNATWPQLIVTVGPGASGPAVSGAQSQLAARINRPAVDGIFGPDTDEVVHGFQQAAGLTADGIVGPNTWNAMVNYDLAATNAEEAAQLVFGAWELDNPVAAARNATSTAVSELFSRSWTAAAGWSFEGSSGAAGSVGNTWKNSTGGSLVIVVNDNAGAPFFFATYVVFS
jgi:peptidoglycan hydrolase-like protein with peptidoglycan-binding domain